MEAEPIQCPQCGSEYAGDAVGEGLKIGRCHRCGSIFRLNRGDETDLLDRSRIAALKKQVRESSKKRAILKHNTPAPGTNEDRRPEPTQRELDLTTAETLMARFRKYGCTCTTWEGHPAFAVEVPLEGIPTKLSVTISVASGVLSFETVVVPLPPPPWLPLRQALNRMNCQSPGPLFLVRECGIVARMKLLRGEAGYEPYPFSRIMQYLCDLHAYRSKTALFLVEAQRRGRMGVDYIEQMFASTLLSGRTGACKHFSADRMRALVRALGYEVLEENGRIYLGKPGIPAWNGTVQLRLKDGIWRGWCGLSEASSAAGGEKWNFVRRLLSARKEKGKTITPNDMGQLLERLNALSDASSMLRYAWHESQIAAMAVYPLEAEEMTPQIVWHVTEVLFRAARAGKTASGMFRYAV